MLFVCDDVEDRLHQAEITDPAGQPLGATGRSLDDRTAAQMLRDIRGRDLGSLSGVTRDRTAPTSTARIEELSRRCCFTKLQRARPQERICQYHRR